MATKTMKQNKEKQSNPFAIITILVLAVYVLSFVIPSGQFARTEANAVIPGSFQFIDKAFLSPINVLLQLPVLVYQSSGKLFITMLIVGGTLRVVQDTKSFDLGIYNLTKKFGTKAVLVIPILLAFTGFLGTASVLISTVIAFIPLGITIARRLDIDNVFAVALMFLGSYTGFMASPISPISTAIAQEIAGIPVFSGLGYRTFLTVVLLVIVAIYLTVYATRVRKDKSKSVMKRVTLDEFGEIEDLSGVKFTINHGLVLIVFFAGFFLFAYGSVNWKFGVSELASVMIPTAILCGFIGKSGFNGGCDSFVKGSQSMASPILFIFFASAVSVILSMSGTLDTIVYYASIPLEALGSSFAAIGMFLANAVINLAIPSGSGQAVVAMPIMAPLSDVVGVSRQVSVLAYQLGDGFTNLLNPTNAMLIASLGLAKASMKDWFKLILPLYGIIFIVICTALIGAVSMGW